MSAPAPTCIVCLDLDGVVRLPIPAGDRGYPRDRLITSGQCRSYFEQGCVWHLNQLLRTTGAKFIIISTQRQLHPWEIVLDALQHSGIDMEHLHPDANVPWTGVRTLDIEQWLTNHPGVSDWCVIDDDPKHYENWQHLDKVFTPNNRYGLQASTKDKIVAHLLGLPKPPEYGQTVPDDDL